MKPACTVCGFDESQLSPPDAAVALRSFGRRFGLALTAPDEDDRPDDVGHRRPESGGLSAAEHGAWVAAGVGEADGAFRAIVYRQDPAVTVPAVDVEPPVAGGEAAVADVVAAIRAAAEEMAGAIGSAPHDAWTRTGRTPTEPVSALDVVRLAVHLGVHHLRLAERTMAEVARQLR